LFGANLFTSHLPSFATAAEKKEDGAETTKVPKSKSLKPKSKVRLATDPTKLYEHGAKEARVVLRNLEFSVWAYSSPPFCRYPSHPFVTI